MLPWYFTSRCSVCSWDAGLCWDGPEVELVVFAVLIFVIKSHQLILCSSWFPFHMNVMGWRWWFQVLVLSREQRLLELCTLFHGVRSDGSQLIGTDLSSVYECVCFLKVCHVSVQLVGLCARKQCGCELKCARTETLPHPATLFITPTCRHLRLADPRGARWPRMWHAAGSTLS